MKHLMMIVGVISLVMFVLVREHTYLVSANVLFVGAILYDKLEDMQNERN